MIWRPRVGFLCQGPKIIFEVNANSLGEEEKTAIPKLPVISLKELWFVTSHAGQSIPLKKLFKNQWTVNCHTLPFSLLAVHFASIAEQHHLPMDHLDLVLREVLGLKEGQSVFVTQGTICPLECPFRDQII